MAIEVIAEEVAANLEEVAEATRRINSLGLSYMGGGLLIGAAAGFYFGYKINKKKIKAEALADAEDQISDMRDYYQAKEIASLEKPALDEIVAEQGYAPHSGSEKVDVPDRPLPAPVPMTGPLDVALSGTAVSKVNYGGHVEPEPEPEVPVSKPTRWNYAQELESRTPTEPYVIHQDEFEDSSHGYEKVEYTYYAEDGVVSGEDNSPVMVANEVVGLNNLKFGHGADDPNVVYIRNDRLELEILLRKVDMSYEVEVMGLDDADTP